MTEKDMMERAIMKKISILLVIVMLVSCLLCFTGCSEYTRDNSNEWQTKFDITHPNLAGAGDSEATANDTGWYSTLIDDFNSWDTSTWACSPEGNRVDGYWCDEMVNITDGKAVITSKNITNNTHKDCKCPENGLFTSGIETRYFNDKGDSIALFEQAFGYFEVRVQLPKSGGMWSAFWLQTENMRNVGNKGVDGSEIDVYESSFYNTKQSNVGHAIHYDGYDPKHHKCGDTVRDTGKNLYDGYHTFAVKWTPDEYVFYVDNEPTWATDFGGVSKVPAFLRLTCEIKPNGTGPYGQKLGEFDDNSEFIIDYVKVYQNKNYL